MHIFVSLHIFVLTVLVSSPPPQKTVDKRKAHTINIEDFRAIYRTIVHRPEFHELFRAYSPNCKILADTELIEFLRKEQYETEACETTALEIILKYEPIEEGMHNLFDF